MRVSRIRNARDVANRFLILSETVLKANNEDSDMISNYENVPTYMTAALRRCSMDLTRALADVRRGDCHGQYEDKKK